MKITKGRYYTDNSDLFVEILKIYYSNDEYFKAKIVLSNKKNGIVYETKCYKIFYENITHWKRLGVLIPENMNWNTKPPGFY